MENIKYIDNLKHALKSAGKTNEYVETCCKYAEHLLEKGIPVLFDKVHVQNVLKLKEIKKNGYHLFNAGNRYKPRKIEAPSVNIKKRQKWILENILEKQELPECAQGFVKGKSIVTNAKYHVGKKFLLCMDIQSFFSFITEDKVEHLFQKIGYSMEVAEELTKLCTFNESDLCCFSEDKNLPVTRYLPQGAPSSPMIANLIFKEIDEAILDMLQGSSITYTRYADDMSFSSELDNLNGIAEKVERIIKRYGFIINKGKTRFMGEKTPKILTGLNITTNLKVPAKFKRKLRQEIYFCKKYGVKDHLEKVSCEKKSNFNEYLYGKAYYIKMIEPQTGENFLKELDEIFSKEYI